MVLKSNKQHPKSLHIKIAIVELLGTVRENGNISFD